jgi:NADH-quinone oxidoreductase subunit G
VHAAEFVVALSPFQHRATEYADVLLPIAPFTETAGTFVNTEGRVQSFKGVVAPLGETRPAWKVLRVLGNLLGLDGFGYETAEDVLAAALPGGGDVASRLDNALKPGQAAGNLPTPRSTLQRIGDVPIHWADPLVRRAPSLQKTHDAESPQAWMNAATLSQLGLQAGDQVRVSQAGQSALLFAGLDPRTPDRAVRISAGHPLTAGLGPLFGDIDVERVATGARASA